MMRDKIVLGESGKPFGKPWFYANWVVFCVAYIVAILQKHRNGQAPAVFGFCGIALISMAIHAVYTGYFVGRVTISREERPGAFGFSVILFFFLGLFWSLLTWAS